MSGQKWSSSHAAHILSVDGVQRENSYSLVLQAGPHSEALERLPRQNELFGHGLHCMSDTLVHGDTRTVLAGQTLNSHLTRDTLSGQNHSLSHGTHTRSVVDEQLETSYSPGLHFRAHSDALAVFPAQNSPGGQGSQTMSDVFVHWAISNVPGGQNANLHLNLDTLSGQNHSLAHGSHTRSVVDEQLEVSYSPSSHGGVQFDSDRLPRQNDSSGHGGHTISDTLVHATSSYVPGWQWVAWQGLADSPSRQNHSNGHAVHWRLVVGVQFVV